MLQESIEHGGHLNETCRKLSLSSYGHKEISELMDCSVEDSRSQLHQARMKLRHLLHKKKDNPQELTLTS
jgi:DNA-directed RNA polymerase specialized sigma24 family protein